MSSKLFQVKLAREIHKELKEHAATQETPMSQCVAIALVQYLERKRMEK